MVQVCLNRSQGLIRAGLRVLGLLDRGADLLRARAEKRWPFLHAQVHDRAGDDGKVDPLENLADGLLRGVRLLLLSTPSGSRAEKQNKERKRENQPASPCHLASLAG